MIDDEENADYFLTHKTYTSQYSHAAADKLTEYLRHYPASGVKLFIARQVFSVDEASETFLSLQSIASAAKL